MPLISIVPVVGPRKLNGIVAPVTVLFAVLDSVSVATQIGNFDADGRNVAVDD